MAILPESGSNIVPDYTKETSHEMEKHHKDIKNKTYHEITMSDIKETFSEDFCDEIEDSNRYCDMADAAKDEGHEELAKGLYEMAYDEYTHAKFIYDHLIDWGCKIPENESMKWHELKERIHRKFRR